MVAMVSYVVDNGLDVLLAQIDAIAPGRSKASDGSIGDAAHQARTSDHNPESPPPPGNPDDQVDARDFTHDPAHGADMGQISERIRLSRDRRVRYVIFSGRIFYGYNRPDLPAFTWTEYHGTDDHSGNMHVSVNDIHHDETQPWSIGMDKSDEKALINRVNAMIDMAPVNPFGDSLKPEPNKLAEALNQIMAGMGELAPLLTSILARLEALEQGPAPTYTGTATLTLQSHAPEVADLLLGEMDRGGQ
jgi:hypothetical protein